MKNYFNWLIITLIFSLNYSYAQDKDFQISVGSQLYISKLDWSIAGTIDGTDPNVLSELKYSNVLTLGPELEFVYRVHKKISVFLDYQRGLTISGKANDRDFSGDNRTNMTYDETFLSNKGYQSSIKLGGRYTFLNFNRISFNTGAHINQNKHRFYLLKDEIPDLNTTYDTRWKVLSLNIGADYIMNKETSISSEVAYSFIKYGSKANWNLIKDFQHPLSFEQWANGNGWSIKIQVERKIADRFNLYIGMLSGKQSSSDGVDIAYYKYGNSKTTRFNGSSYYTTGVSFGLIYGI
ncbi:hypothetical protein ACR78Z_18665 [Sphingobacterium thalpophilum]|uniref:Protochlamydia outer membrane protein domain-containing protein n=1 Tax=Sphingobacterium thalpophilum TaxID=259 RepID=A0A4U9URW7_9SPHI|nr:hypothetical protein [Sphingobacterium thalpophilum]VTR32644.1 Uncharacterised protein [Sphingobacterium thalpophilum]